MDATSSVENSEDDYKNIKPAKKHFPSTKQEVDAFADRMENISRILQDYLSEDPLEAAERRRQREAARVEEKANAEIQRLRERYDPKRYSRFESDEMINKLLEEVDKPPPPPKQPQPHLSEFERLSLDEALRQKSEGNDQFALGNWIKAKELYSRAISLDIVDDELTLALRNNRSQVNVLLKDYVEAVDDATFVLRRHPTNVKARLRRATALSALHRPHEAFIDIEEALRGDTKNAEAIKLLTRVELEKCEMEWCFEFEQSNRPAAKDLEEISVRLRSFLNGCSEIESTEATLDGEFISALAADFLRAEEVLGEQGSETLFRLRGGWAATMEILQLLVSFSRLGKLCGLLGQKTMAAGLRLLALCNRSEVTRSQVTPEMAVEWVETCGQFISGSGPLYEGLVCDRSSVGYEEASQLVVFASLQLMHSLAVSHASIVAKAFPPNNVGKLITRKPDAKMYQALRLFDALLRDDGCAAIYSSFDFVTPCVAALRMKHTLFSEAAVALLLRISVVYPAHLDEPLSQKDVMNCLFEVIRASVDNTAKIIGSATLEGVCSLLYNRAVQQSSDERVKWAKELEEASVFTFLVQWLTRFAVSVNVRPGSMSSVSTAARALGVLGKAVGANPIVAGSLVDAEANVLWPMVSMWKLCDSTVRSDTRRCVEQCVEHASMCLAVLYTKNHINCAALSDPKKMGMLLALLTLKQQPITVGNVAMIVSLIPKEAHYEFDQLDCIPCMLDCLIALRTDLFELERSGRRDTTEHQHTRLAQKNCAIALSRLCTTETLLQKVRDSKGFEILYAALDRNPDGSIKD